MVLHLGRLDVCAAGAAQSRGREVLQADTSYSFWHHPKLWIRLVLPTIRSTNMDIV